MEYCCLYVAQVNIRVTTDVPRKVSIIDCVMASKHCNKNTASKLIERIIDPTVRDKIEYHKFPGQGQRPTPVVDANTLLEVMARLPGVINKFVADTAVRLLGGDLSLATEVKAMHELQQQLPANHFGRVFGEAVEAKLAAEQPKEALEWHERRQKAKEESKRKSALLLENVANATPADYRNTNAKVSRTALGVFPSELHKQICPQKKTFNSRDHMTNKQQYFVAFAECVVAEKIEEQKIDRADLGKKIDPEIDRLFETGKQFNLHGQFLLHPPKQPLSIEPSPPPPLQASSSNCSAPPQAPLATQIVVKGKQSTINCYFGKNE